MSESKEDSNIKIYDWTDEQGITHKIPEGSCVICKHCTDIYLDPWCGNRIYACLCEIHDESKSRECDDFKLDRSCVDFEKE